MKASTAVASTGTYLTLHPPASKSRLGLAVAAAARIEMPWRAPDAWCSSALSGGRDHPSAIASPGPKPYSRLGSATAAVAWLKALWRPSNAWYSPAVTCGRECKPSAQALQQAWVGSRRGCLAQGALAALGAWCSPALACGRALKPSAPPCAGA